MNDFGILFIAAVLVSCASGVWIGIATRNAILGGAVVMALLAIGLFMEAATSLAKVMP